MDKTQRPTIKDLARESGLSIGTVDRVLHRRGRYSPESAGRVQSAVAKLGYTTNIFASNLKTARSFHIFGLIPQLSSDGGYWRAAAQSMTKAAADLAHHSLAFVLCEYDRFSDESFRRAAETAASNAAAVVSTPHGHAGFILAPTNGDAALAFCRRHHNLPMLSFDGELPGDDPPPSIAQDSYQSGILAARLLLLSAPCAQSSPRFAVVTIGSRDHHLRRRRDGFCRYFVGDDRHLVVKIDFESTPSRQSLISRLVAEGPFTGMFVTNSAAHLVVEAAATAFPAREPPAAIGYDLLEENVRALYSDRIAFLFDQDPERQGRAAVAAMYRRLVLGEAIPQYTRIPIDVVIKETLAAHSIGPDGR